MADRNEKPCDGSKSNVVYLDDIANNHLRSAAIAYVGGRAIANAHDFLAELQRELSLRGKPTDHMSSWVEVGTRLSDFIGSERHASTLWKTGWHCSGRPIYRFKGGGRNEWFVEPSSGEPIVVCVAACSRLDAPLTKHQIGAAILGIPPGPVLSALRQPLEMVSDGVEALCKDWNHITRSQLEDMFYHQARDISKIEPGRIGLPSTEPRDAVFAAILRFGASDFEIEANIDGYTWIENIVL